MLESKFQSDLIKDLRDLFDGCIITKLDPNALQGIPDLLILFGDRWATLEVKKNRTARRQVNQTYYVDLMDSMSFSAVIYPENKEDVLHALHLHFAPAARRAARVPQR